MQTHTALAAISAASLPVELAPSLQCVLPDALDPGQKARKALSTTGGDELFRDLSWTRLILRSQLRSELLRLCLKYWSREELDRFAGTAVAWKGKERLMDARSSGRPLLIVSAHYGAFAVLCSVLARLLDPDTLNTFYEDPGKNPGNAGFEALYARTTPNVKAIVTSRRAVVSALKALKRGEHLTMMPDVYMDVADTFAVPFFGRLLRVMGGTAFLGLNSDALIVPLYARPGKRLSLEIEVGQVIDPAAFRSGDPRQRVFDLTSAVFSDMEGQMRKSPEHWRYWHTYPRISTSLEATAASHAFGAMLYSRIARSPYLAGIFPPSVLAGLHANAIGSSSTHQGN